MNTVEAKKVLETALLCTHEALSINELKKLFAGHPDEAESVPDTDAIKAMLEELVQDWEGHGVELVNLSTREGVTQSFLLVAPPSNKPAAAVVLLPGGNGAIRLRSDGGEIKFQDGNFLVRSRMSFVDGGLAAAVIDAPSDESRGMNDVFRLGEKHAADMAAVVAELKKRFDNVPVYLVGTSRGTISAAGAGSQLGDKVAGVVLTSSLFVGSRAGSGLSAAPARPAPGSSHAVRRRS